MPDLTEPEFPLYGGRVCLNLVATLGKRHAEPAERIPDAAALARWLVAAEVLPAEMITTIPAAQAERFRVLREAVNRLVRASMAGDVLPADDVEVLNQAAAHPDLVTQLVGRSAVIVPGQRRPVDAALATIARDAVHLLAGPRADRVKECGNPDCSLLFFDESQSGRRRWCSMDRCGNLAKIHGYRARKR